MRYFKVLRCVMCIYEYDNLRIMYVVVPLYNQSLLAIV